MDSNPTSLSIAFIGASLGPLYLVDPEQGACSQLLEAFLIADAEQLGREWPFVDDSEAAALIAQMKQGLGGDPDEMVWEFRRLFAIGPTPKPAPPWGSYYTDREGAICSVATLELRRWLAAQGIGQAAGDGKVEDHVGHMLTLMSWMALNAPNLLPEFLSRHFLVWTEHFLGILQDSTAHPFYLGLAALTNASLCGIRDELQLSITYPRFYR
ncbi:MAG: molecular chaperone TorD family protein [Coriobacteriia bacterium]|nr:molecular chaperone TorD family protein [Coriobacteriia bacterium]